MPYYKGVIDELIVKGFEADAKHVAGRLLSLRRHLSKTIPPRNVLSSLLIATWNIREFGADAKYGRRLDESLLYIAEIVSRFDLVAIQEVNKNLANLQKLAQLLGGWWDYLVTDVTLGNSGNSERIAFIYDGRKVRFDRLAGELTLPAVKNAPVVQPARSPFICAFKAGWRRISLCSVHIYFGQSTPNDPRRVEEIRAVSQALANRNEARQNIADGEPESVVLLGDFNIFDATEDKTSEALESNGFVVPKALRMPPEQRIVSHAGDEGDDGDEDHEEAAPGVEGGRGTNLARTRHFDQIAFHDPKKLLLASRGGVFDFQDVIYGSDEVDRYRGAMQRSTPAKFEEVASDPAELTKLYRQWRTFQLSDHLPLWVELKTDFADNYLGSVLRGRKPSTTANRQRKRAEATSPVTTPPPIADTPTQPESKDGARAGSKSKPRKGGADAAE